MELVHCPSCGALGPAPSGVCQECKKPIPEVPAAPPPLPLEPEPEVEPPASAATPPFDAPPEVLKEIERLEERIAAKPDARALYLQLSQIYIDRERRDLATEVLERLLAFDPKNAYVRHRVEQLSRPDAPTLAPAGRQGKLGPRPRPRPPRPAGSLDRVKDLVSGNPKLVALAVGLFAVAVVSIWLAFPTTRVVASGEFRAFGPKWSPSGAHVAFFVASERVELAIYDVRQRSFRVIGEIWGSDLSSIAWSPDGGRIAYEGPPKEGEWEPSIWIADAVTGETRAIGAGFAPAWYSDGAGLLVGCTPKFSASFSLDEWTRPGQSHCRLDTVTGHSEEVLQVDAWEVSFSPAANKIAFTSVEFDEESLQSGFDGSDTEFEQFVDRVLADDPSNFLEGSRDLSRELEARRYMESKKGGAAGDATSFYQTDVFVMDLLDRRPNRLTSDGRSTFISWTPDGRQILYARAEGSGVEVRAVSPDGSNERVIVPSSLELVDPRAVTLTEDGRYALFVAPVDADPGVAKIMTGEDPADLHVLEVGSSSPKRLSNKHPFKQRYAVSPDGKHVVYEVLTDVRLLKRDTGSELWLMSR